MPNTKSAKKALIQSKKKRSFNLRWKRSIQNTKKELQELLRTKGSGLDILKEKESLLQKTLDKAAKKKVISKNKANRLKSRYAQKVTAYTKQDSAKPIKKAAATTKKKPTKAKAEK